MKISASRSNSQKGEVEPAKKSPQKKKKKKKPPEKR